MYILLLATLNFGPTQRGLTHAVAQTLSQKLNTEVVIEQIEVGLFNRLILKGVRIKDKQDKDLLKARLMTAKIELRSLFKHQLALRTISLLDADIALYKKSKGEPANFQFIIDAFSGKKKKEKSDLDLRINSLILRRVNLSYDELYVPRTPQRLNPARLNVKNINANISLKGITPDSINLHVRSLSLQEQSGFSLDELRFRLHANRKEAKIRDFELALPHSRIAQSELYATYDARKEWKNLWPTLQIHGHMHHAQIAASDLKPLVRLPQKMEIGVELSTRFVITPTSIALKQIQVTDTEGLLKMSAEATLYKGQGRLTGLHAQVNGLTLAQELSTRAIGWVSGDTVLANAVKRAGDLALTGACTYVPDGESTGNINLQTGVGLLAAQGTWKEGKLHSAIKLTHANPAALSGNHKLPQIVTLNGQVFLGIKDKKVSEVGGQLDVATLLWNNYKYRDITLKGAYKPGYADLRIDCDDPGANIHAQATATLKNKKINTLALNGEIGKFSPHQVGLETPYGTAVFGAEMDVNLNRLASTTPTGHLRIKNFSMENAPQGDYSLDKLEAHLMQLPGEKGELDITSDFLDATLRGPLSAERIANGLKATLHRCLPGLLRKPAAPVALSDKWLLKATFKDAEVLKKMLNLKIGFESPVYLQGNFDATGKRSSLSAFTDRLSVAGQEFISPSLYLHGENKEYQCLLKTRKDLSKRSIHLVADFSTRDSMLVTQIDWNGNKGEAYKGAFKSDMRFFSGSNAVNFKMNVHPTQFALDGTVWDISSGNLSLIDREISFNKISVSHGEQALTIDGKLSPQQNDSITADLKKIDINYILELVNFHAVEFGGQATGKAIFTKSAEHPELHAKLNIPNFTFNGGPMGNTNIIGSWSSRNNRILLDADMRLPQGHDIGTKVKGFVSLAEKGLQLDISANRTNLRFLRRYMDGIFEDFNGEATGRVKLYGPFKKLDFKGDLTAQASARIMATGVRYSISDGRVRLTPGEFAFNHFKVEDGRGGVGEASGHLRHTHLKDLNYAFDLSATRLLCYDQPQSHDMPFYSTTTGTGRVHLQGSPGRFTADINLRPDAPTTLVYNLGSSEALSTDDSMIKFGTIEPEGPNKWFAPASDGKTAETQNEEKPAESTTDIVLNFLIEANPAAEVQIVTDPRSGDMLTAYGEGPIRATYHNKGDFEMYGTYRLTRGSYKLSLQDVIRKDLSLQRGSTITFGGNPLEADLGLRAVYTVNGVSLSDLNYGAGFSQKSVRVDCVLNIGGKAKAPQVNFDLDLHNISEDEKQMVRQLIATDEDMNRQVIYLLGIGRFYTANTQSSVGQPSTQQQSAAAMRSFLSTTLTGQLNTAISSALGNKSHWSFGTNVAPGTLGWSDIEVDGLLQGRLFNDRLLINGNFGYRDRPTYTSNFVGDFDIRYLLTPRGSISLRAYSETSDRYFTKSSLTTQGVGVTLQRDFNTLRDLFNIRKKKAKQAEKEEGK